jgi:hypothetical protein
MIGKLGNQLMFLAVVWPHLRPACLANWHSYFSDATFIAASAYINK